MRGGACDRAGRFSAGVTGLREHEEVGPGALYRVDFDGVVSTAATGLIEPVGIAWSPDDVVLDLADSGARTVTAHDCDVDLGTLERPRA